MSLNDDRFVTLAHGNGGRLMRGLIEQVFVRHLANPDLDVQADAATLPLPPGEVMMTTDGFTVQPLEFPGGDIGSLAVHGTVTDLAVSGATPIYLTLSAFIEEGFELVVLDRLIASMARAANDAKVRVAAGDLKVLPRTARRWPYASLPRGLAFGPQVCASALIKVRPERRGPRQRPGRRSRHVGAAGARGVRAAR